MDWNYILAAAIILAGILAAGIAHFVTRWLRQKAEKTKIQLDDILLISTEGPLIAFILATSVIIALKTYDVLPPSLSWIVSPAVVHTVYIVIGAWIASVLLFNIIHVYGRKLAQDTESDFDVRFIPLLEISVKILVWFIAFLLILDTLQIDITPFLAGAGIAGLAVALAAQDILGNFLSGAIITVDKPFKVGDRIKFEDIFGDVIGVGPRSTRIKTLDNLFVTIPNSKITSNVVTNYAMPDIKMKVRVPFSVAYGSDIKRVKQILLGIAREAAEKTSWVLADPAPLVFFLEFGESSLNGQLLLWTNNYDNSWDVQDWVNIRIDERFREEGIEIPFRQVDVRMRSGKTGG
jgi:MscS family membrane protein